MWDVTCTNQSFFIKSLITTPPPIWNKCLFREAICKHHIFSEICHFQYRKENFSKKKPRSNTAELSFGMNFWLNQLDRLHRSMPLKMVEVDKPSSSRLTASDPFSSPEPFSLGHSLKIRLWDKRIRTQSSGLRFATTSEICYGNITAHPQIWAKCIARCIEVMLLMMSQTYVDIRACVSSQYREGGI